MQTPLISVIMPAFNCDRFVKMAIDSVLNQTYGNFELLIADDCSTDNTKAIIDGYTDTRIKAYHNEINLGYLKASNKLLQKCSGQFITFQDADDYSDANRLQKLIDYLNQHQHISCVGSNITKVDANNIAFFVSKFYVTDSEIRNAYINYKITYTGSALMIRREVLDRVGIYNEYFDRIGSEDTYWYSFILDNFKVANIEEALYYYRANPNSVTANHKNPKAYVGHQLIIHFYKQRLIGKADYIFNNDWNSADVCASFLIVINSLKTNKLTALIKYLLLTLKHPFISLQFSREFVAKLRTA